jgi:hypothetical protein
MTTDNVARVAETQRQLVGLRDATRLRHSLATGTPEYDAAFRAEERLVVALWRRLEVSQEPSRLPSEEEDQPADGGAFGELFGANSRRTP